MANLGTSQRQDLSSHMCGDAELLKFIKEHGQGECLERKCVVAETSLRALLVSSWS